MTPQTSTRLKAAAANTGINDAAFIDVTPRTTKVAASAATRSPTRQPRAEAEAASCARRLRDLAADERYFPRKPDLESLAEEIDDPTVDTWTGVDLFQAFPQPSTIVAPHGSRFEGLLGVLGTVAVFGPVAWTWYSLRAASAAYNDLMGSGYRGEETFLSLWITGFDGRLAEIHRLIFVSGVSVFLILLAAALLIAQHTISRASAARDEQHALLAETELVSALTQAQRILNGRQADNPASLAQLVRRSMQYLNDAHAATQAGVEHLGEAVAKSTTATQAGIDKLGATMEKSDGALSKLLDRLAGTTDAMHGAVQVLERAEKDLGGAIDRHDRGVAQSLATFTTGVNTAVANVETGTLATIRRSEQLSNKATKTGDDIAAQLAQLSELLERLDAGLDRHDSAQQAQASELTATRDAAERMLDRLMIGAGPRAYA